MRSESGGVLHLSTIIEIANVLPGTVKEAESKQRYVFRFLANKHVILHDVMKGYIPDWLRLLTEKVQTAIIAKFI